MQNPWCEYAAEKLSQLTDPNKSPVGNRNHDFVLPADRATCDFENVYVRPLCLQTYLPPVPYVGDPQKTEVIILAANPGFVGNGDDPEYCNNRLFVEQSLKSLRFESDYPIHYLDERFGAQDKALEPVMHL